MHHICTRQLEKVAILKIIVTANVLIKTFGKDYNKGKYSKDDKAYVRVTKSERALRMAIRKQRHGTPRR